MKSGKNTWSAQFPFLAPRQCQSFYLVHRCPDNLVLTETYCWSNWKDWRAICYQSHMIPASTSHLELHQITRYIILLSKMKATHGRACCYRGINKVLSLHPQKKKKKKSPQDGKQALLGQMNSFLCIVQFCAELGVSICFSFSFSFWVTAELQSMVSNSNCHDFSYLTLSMNLTFEQYKRKQKLNTKQKLLQK